MQGLGQLRCVDRGSAPHPSRTRAEALNPPCAPAPSRARALCAAAPACTWLAGSSRRPAAAHRRCARARAPGGTAHASAPAWRRRCSRWVGGTMEYFSVLGDSRSHRLALQGAPNAPGALPSGPVHLFLTPDPGGNPSDGKVALPTTGRGDHTQHLPLSRCLFCCPGEGPTV